MSGSLLPTAAELAAGRRQVAILQLRLRRVEIAIGDMQVRLADVHRDREQLLQAVNDREAAIAHELRMLYLQRATDTGQRLELERTGRLQEAARLRRKIEILEARLRAQAARVDRRAEEREMVERLSMRPRR